MKSVSLAKYSADTIASVPIRAIAGILATRTIGGASIVS